MQNKDRMFYDEEGFDNQSYTKHMIEVAQRHFGSMWPTISHKLPDSINNLIEIGAGTCAMGTLVGRELKVEQIIFTDISLKRLEASYQVTSHHFEYCPKELQLVELDMNEPFTMFDDNSIDMVLFSASLHHARNIWNCLSESYRILRPNGILLAVREAMCPLLRSRQIFTKLLNTPEVQSGVSENCYIVDEYLYYLRANRFDAVAIPLTEGNHKGLKKILWFTNRYLFASYTLLGKKVE